MSKSTDQQCDHFGKILYLIIFFSILANAKFSKYCTAAAGSRINVQVSLFTFYCVANVIDMPVTIISSGNSRAKIKVQFSVTNCWIEYFYHRFIY